MVQCNFCGRYREQGDPHSDQETCPYASSHELLKDNQIYPDDTLFEAIKNVVSGNSVMLRGWCSNYPLFRTVVETRTWVPSDSASTPIERGTESPATSYWKKTIWTASNNESIYRIEYDPASPSLIEWYELTEDAETQQHTGFGIFARKESSDVSFFGSSLPT
jgi:hypothetical protein